MVAKDLSDLRLRGIPCFNITYDRDMPESVNHLYITGMHGGKVLSAAGRQFRDGLCKAVAEATMHVAGGWRQKIDDVYDRRCAVEVFYTIYFADLLNKSWRPGKVNKSGNAQCPFKRQDASNYIKVIEDAVVEGTGIDDAAHFWTHVSKEWDPDHPRIVINYSIWTMDWPSGD